MRNRIDTGKLRVILLLILVVGITYLIFAFTVGRTPTHIMGTLANPYHLLTVIILALMFGCALARYRRPRTIFGGLIIGLIFGYCSSYLGYLITELLGDYARTTHTIASLKLGVLLEGQVLAPIILFGWLPGAVAGAASGALYRLYPD